MNINSYLKLNKDQKPKSVVKERKSLTQVFRLTSLRLSRHPSHSCVFPQAPGETGNRWQRQYPGLIFFYTGLFLMGLFFIQAQGCKEPPTPSPSSKGGGKASKSSVDSIKKTKTSSEDKWKIIFKDDPENYKKFQEIQQKFRVGQFPAAIQGLEKLLKGAPQAPWAETVEFQLIQSKRMLKDNKGALQGFTDFLTRYPNSPLVPKAMIGKGEIYLVMAKGKGESVSSDSSSKNSYIKKALEMFEQLAEKYPDNQSIQAQASYRISTTYFAIKDYAQAGTGFRKVVDEYPNSAFADKALYSLAGVFLCQADVDGAEQAFRELIERYPDTNKAKKAKKKLEGIGLVGHKVSALQIKEWIGEPPPNLEGYPQKLTIISFWAIWCPHCKKNVPKLNRLAEAYATKDVVVIGISRERKKYEAEIIRQYIEKHPMKFSTGVDDNNKTSRAFAVANIPCVVVVDAQKRICWHGHPEFLTETVIESLLKTN